MRRGWLKPARHLRVRLHHLPSNSCRQELRSQSRRMPYPPCALQESLDRRKICANIAALRNKNTDAIDLIRLRIGKRFQQDRIDGAEDRGIRADAEGHSEHRHRGVAFMPQQYSQAIA